MFHDVVAPGMSLDLWLKLRADLRGRIVHTMGQEPPLPPAEPCQVVDTQERHGLTMQEVRFPVAEGLTAAAVLVYRQEPRGEHAHPGVVCIHGTSDLGRYNMIDPERSPRRIYGLELARRGFLAITADQFGFGDWRSPGQSHDECVAEFWRRVAVTCGTMAPAVPARRLAPA